MRVDEIREALRKQPFQPFRIHLADGRQFPVQHVDFLLISHTGRSIIVAELGGGYEVIDPLLATSLSFSEPADAKGA
jgi:hypothetical protein